MDGDMNLIGQPEPIIDNEEIQNNPVKEKSKGITSIAISALSLIPRGVAGAIGTAVWIPYKMVKMAACASMGAWNSGTPSFKEKHDGDEITATHAIFSTGEGGLVEEKVKFAPKFNDQNLPQDPTTPQWVSCNETRYWKERGGKSSDLRCVIPNLAVHSLKKKPTKGDVETDVGQRSDLSESDGDFDSNQSVSSLITVDIDDKVVQSSLSISRSGAITDATSPCISLRNLEKLKDPKTKDKEIKALGPRFNAIQKKNKNETDNPPAKDLEAAESLVKSKNSSELETKYNERRDRLGNQFVQLLRFQLENGVGEIAGGKFSMQGIGLVGKAIKIDSGLIMSEEVMQEDTAAIYDIFNGFTVEFTDGNTEANIDYANQVIKIPRPESVAQSLTKFTLQTAYFNISTQGDQTNTGSQLETNRKAVVRLFGMDENVLNSSDFIQSLQENEEFKKLSPKDKKLFTEVCKENSILTDADAEALGSLLRKRNPQAAQHRNCVSGKDRTSNTTGNELKREIEEELGGWIPTIAHGFNSVTNKVIEVNTGKREFKADPTASGRSWFTTLDIISAKFWSTIYGKGGSKT